MDTSISQLCYTAGLSKRNTRIFYYCIIVLLHFHMHFWLHEISEISFLTRLCFLTNISFYLNLIYYSYVLIMHVPYGKKLENFRFLQAYFKVSFTISFVVFVLYWGLVITNPELLYSKTEIALPLALDLFLHGANFILNLLEHVYVFPKSDSDSINYFTCIFICITYGIFLKIIYVTHKIIIYPFISLGVIEYSVILGISFILTSLGKMTYSLLLKKNVTIKKIN